MRSNQTNHKWKAHGILFAFCPICCLFLISMLKAIYLIYFMCIMITWGVRGFFSASLLESFCRLKATGVQMYTRKVADLWELRSEYNIIVNCTGIGAHQLVGDEKLFPVRGQVLKAHAPWVKNFVRDGDGLTYIYPGIHRVTLGGTREKERWSLSPDPGTTKDIFARCCSLEPSLRGAQDIEVKVGLRPSRWCVRLEREVLSRGGVKLLVVHNYGHGAGGFSVHRGTAKEAARLVGECIATLQGSSSRAKLWIPEPPFPFTIGYYCIS